MWRDLGDFESCSVLYSSPISIEKELFCMPVEGFFPRGALLEVYLVEWDLVFGSGSPPGRFGGGGHYECFRILVGLLCHL